MAYSSRVINLTNTAILILNFFMLIIKKNHHDILFPYRVTSLVPHWGSVSDHEGVGHRKEECSSFCHMTCSSAPLFLSKASVMLQYTTLEISQLKEENTVFFFLIFMAEMLGCLSIEFLA